MSRMLTLLFLILAPVSVHGIGAIPTASGRAYLLRTADGDSLVGRILSVQSGKVAFSTEDGQVLGEAVVETVENQIRNDDPPEVREALKRLMALGESKENAMRYIASVLSVEFFEIMKNQTSYNEARYIKNLNELPDLPFDDEE